jgi:hypothetical protein
MIVCFFFGGGGSGSTSLAVALEEDRLFGAGYCCRMNEFGFGLVPEDF